MDKIKIFRLKKDINSPQFNRTIEAGRIYTGSQLESFLNINECHSNFKEWFDDVSDEVKESIKKEKQKIVNNG